MPAPIWLRSDINTGYQSMRLSPLSRATSLLAVSAFVFVFALAACSSGNEEESTRSAVTPDPAAVDADDPVANGEAVFKANVCSACHSTGDITIVGPGLSGVGDRAASRVSGLSADEYLEQSVREPGTFVVDGFTNAMPANFSGLSEGDMTDLIAYLKGL
jgi:cytochrome c2